MKTRFCAWLALAAAAAVLAGCGGGKSDSSAGKVAQGRVVATTGMIEWMTRQIAGDAAQVVALMGPGVDPHLYKASEGDVRRLGEADLVLFNGLHLEGKMGDILGKMGQSRPVVPVSRDLPHGELRRLAGTQDQHDPHIWFDVRLWAKTVPLIETELGKVYPEHKAAFARNAAQLAQDLASLDAWVASAIATIPKEQRLLVTAHDAFGYFGDRYDIEVKGLQGVSTVAEAGLQDVENLVALIVSRKIKAVFVESSVPKRSIEAVQAACRAKGHEVVIGGQLFSDAMGAAGTPEGSYPGMVRHNVNAIVEALR